MTIRGVATMILAAGVAAAALVHPAEARDSDRSFGYYHGWGPRVGLSSDPDQIYVGGHLDLGDIVEKQLRFQPSFEVGFGDDVTSFQLDGNVLFTFTSDWEAWRPYAGGALGFYMQTANGEDNTAVGISAVGGIEKNFGGDGVFIETKIGIDDDSPDFKIGIGWIF